MNWHKITEEKPQEGQVCLVWAPGYDLDHGYDLSRYDSGRWLWLEPKHQIEITHWTGLSSPEEKGNDQSKNKTYK